jgi:hypothetical protein
MSTMVRIPLVGANCEAGISAGQRLFVLVPGAGLEPASSVLSRIMWLFLVLSSRIQLIRTEADVDAIHTRTATNVRFYVWFIDFGADPHRP